MVMIKDKEGIERYSLREEEYKFLLRAKEKITKEDQEFWVCYGGDTGTGKSLKSMWHMYVIFPELTIDQICFDKEEFVNAILAAKKGTGIICDESISVLFSRASMTKEGRLIAELIAQIRQKNLAIFLNIPEVTTLDWIAQKKLNAYIHIWESRRKINGRMVTIKGNAAFYPELNGNPFKSKILDYFKKRKSNPLRPITRPAYWIAQEGNPIGEGFKQPWYPVDETKYREKKESILTKYKSKAKQKEEIKKGVFLEDNQIRMLKKNSKISQRALAKALDTSRTTIRRALGEV